MFITHVFGNYTANICIISVPCKTWYLKIPKLQQIFYVIRIFAFFPASISAEKSDLADPILVVTTTILGAIKTTTVIAKNYVPNNLN
jgi:phenylpyruvate tautomerase PptA (4-oxalocrotonate tautomerase family)